MAISYAGVVAVVVRRAIRKSRDVLDRRRCTGRCRHRPHACLVIAIVSLGLFDHLHDTISQQQQQRRRGRGRPANERVLIAHVIVRDASTSVFQSSRAHTTLTFSLVTRISSVARRDQCGIHSSSVCYDKNRRRADRSEYRSQ